MFEQYKSLLLLISAQDISLKNKLLGKPKSTAFSLIFSRVAKMLTGSSFGQEDMSTVFPLRMSGMVAEQLVLKRWLFFFGLFALSGLVNWIKYQKISEIGLVSRKTFKAGEFQEFLGVKL